MQKLQIISNILSEKSSEIGIISCVMERGELFVTAEKAHIRALLLFLKNHQQFPFQIMVDLCVADYLGRPERFEVVYNLLSITFNARITIKVPIAEEELMPTISDIYSAAGWYEREAWDLYGVLFEHHKDLRRILTDYGFVGHPMRKDFPLSGTSEVRYDAEKKKVVYEPVKLTQDYRNFEFASPWQGTKYVLPGDEKAS